MLRIQVSGSPGKTENYEAAIRALGGVPVPGYAPEPDLTCDGLLLCGGGDVDPSRFGQECHGSNPPDLTRDRAEFALFDAFFQAGKPILGICRGMQVINIALGGTLIQDLPSEQLPFHTGEADMVHSLRCAPDSFLEEFYGPQVQVNSSHHQAVDRLGTGLEAAAWAEGDLVEAVAHREKPVWGVQFHPERMSFAHRRPDTADGASIFAMLLVECGKG